MSDVQETLQELVHRRLREMGQKRGRRGALSLLERYNDYVDGLKNPAPFSYETLRQVARGTHSNISERTAEGMATMLDVGVSEVLVAAGRRPRLGPFRLPTRAEGLDDRERKVVLAVVDAILHAHEGSGSTTEDRGLGTRMDEVAKRTLAELDADESAKSERNAREGSGA